MKNRKINPDLFNGTYDYYAKYRPGIPPKVINTIVKHFNITKNDRVIDIGCGTGQVALAMDGKCGEMVCLDSNAEMIKLAKKVTKDLKMKISWLNYNSEDLGKINKKIGTFKVATVSRAFHWLNQKKLLSDLNNLVDENGGIAVFSDGTFWTGQEEWQQVIKKIVQKYLGEERRAGRGTFKEPDEPWEDVIARSAFKFTNIYDIPVLRKWNVENIIGYLFSTSFAAPYLFGDQTEKFKEEIKNTLLSINPKNLFQERAVWSLVLGSRKCLKRAM